MHFVQLDGTVDNSGADTAEEDRDAMRAWVRS